ncbi:MAG: type II toxin-antitoxin system VapC family toxin [Rubrobacteraceae bacterium]|nr:type II toxin-antitoxin system VapC family toxin [Rubrobacteraceae bacterium]
MILYLDTSALVKLYAEEPGTEEVRSAVSEARVVAVSEIGYVEARSALARKEREGAFSAEEHDEAADSLRRDFQGFYLPRPLTGGMEARRRADTIIAQLTQANASLAARVPELEAPREQPGDSETVEEEPERSQLRSDAPGPQTGTERRPWWRRVFGG